MGEPSTAVNPILLGLISTYTVLFVQTSKYSELRPLFGASLGQHGSSVKANCISE